MAAKDLFSEHAKQYAAFRPNYPQSLYDHLFKHLHAKNIAWDCATGNGQVAAYLAQHFRKVYATDISATQLAEATPAPNIQYDVCAAEQTSFPRQHFDLITVAQAFHWIDAKRFYEEVKRIAKPGSLLALWGYGLLSVAPSLDAKIRHFYKSVVGPYWDAARKLVDDEYQSIEFPFDEITTTEKFSIDVGWTIDHLQGYLETWSATRQYIKINHVNPVPSLIEELKKDWTEGEIKKISFPIFLRLGKIS